MISDVFNNDQLSKNMYAIWLLVNGWDEMHEYLEHPDNRVSKLELFNSIGHLRTQFGLDLDICINLEAYRRTLHIQYLDMLKAKYGERVHHFDAKYPNAIYVARGRGSKLGNMFSHKKDVSGVEQVDSLIEACIGYKIAMQQRIQFELLDKNTCILLHHIGKQKSHVTCWCNRSGADTSVDNPDAINHYCHGLIVCALGDAFNNPT